MDYGSILKELDKALEKAETTEKEFDTCKESMSRFNKLSEQSKDNGLLFTEDNVPSNGSDFNFTPQAGLGFTFDAGDSARWLIGLRWYHISNANSHRSNPGRDSVMLWVGMTFPF